MRAARVVVARVVVARVVVARVVVARVAVARVAVVAVVMERVEAKLAAARAHEKCVVCMIEAAFTPPRAGERRNGTAGLAREHGMAGLAWAGLTSHRHSRDGAGSGAWHSEAGRVGLRVPPRAGECLQLLEVEGRAGEHAHGRTRAAGRMQRPAVS